MASLQASPWSCRNMALTDSENLPPRASAFRLPARVRAWLSSEHGATQRMAGTAFVIRVAGAVVIFLSQILLARWMGGVEFGIYVYAWTWLQMVGDIIHLGLPLTAQRTIPEYTQRNDLDGLRGFLIGSRWIVFAAATTVAAARRARGACARAIARQRHRHAALSRLRRAAALPGEQHARRAGAPLQRRQHRAAAALRAAPAHADRGDGRGALRLASPPTPRPRWPRSPSPPGRRRWSSSSCSTAASPAKVPAGPRRYDVSAWIKTASPIFAVWAFYMLLTYTDVLVLRQFRPPEEVAHYYAAAKILALVTFIHFSVSAAVAHRFAAHHVAGDRAALAALAASTVRWTFWPSLAAIALMLALRQADPLAVRAGLPGRLSADVHPGDRARSRGPRSARPSACSTCWASSAAARWSMPPCSR